jgi:hypothetical protein
MRDWPRERDRERETERQRETERERERERQRDRERGREEDVTHREVDDQRERGFEVGWTLLQKELVLHLEKRFAFSELSLSLEEPFDHLSKGGGQVL